MATSTEAVIRDGAFFSELEATPGSAETIEEADAVYTTGPIGMQFLGSGVIERDGPTPAMRNLAGHEPVAKHVAVEVETEIKTTDVTADQKCELHDLTLASGFAHSEVTGTSQTYTLSGYPNGSDLNSVTCQLEEAPDGKGHKYVIAGARAGLRLSQGPNTPPRAAFSLLGGWTTPADLPTGLKPDPATEYHQGSPIGRMAWGSTPVTIHSDTGLILRSWSLDVGLTPQLYESDGDTSGYALPMYLARTGPVRGEIEVMFVDQAQFSLYSAIEAGTLDDLTLVYTDGTRSWTITAVDVQFDMAAPEGGTPKSITIPYMVRGDLTLVYT